MLLMLQWMRLPFLCISLTLRKKLVKVRGFVRVSLGFRFRFRFRQRTEEFRLAHWLEAWVMLRLLVQKRYARTHAPRTRSAHPDHSRRLSSKTFALAEVVSPNPPWRKGFRPFRPIKTGLAKCFATFARRKFRLSPDTLPSVRLIVQIARSEIDRGRSACCLRKTPQSN